MPNLTQAEADALFALPKRCREDKEHVLPKLGERLNLPLGVPRLHLYREGYAAQWAFPVPLERFSNLTSYTIVLAKGHRLPDCGLVHRPPCAAAAQ